MPYDQIYSNQYQQKRYVSSADVVPNLKLIETTKPYKEELNRLGSYENGALVTTDPRTYIERNFHRWGNC